MTVVAVRRYLITKGNVHMQDDSNIKGLTEQIVFAAALRWLSGEPVSVKFDGTDVQVSVVKEALEASRSFLSELHDPAATTLSVMDSYARKQSAAAKFTAVMGIRWLV